jgi:predicted Fe-Mo cluster-binding NifX family protein
MGPGAFRRIREELGIKVYLVPENVKFLKDAVSLFKEGKLEELLEPNEDSH